MTRDCARNIETSSENEVRMWVLPAAGRMALGFVGLAGAVFTVIVLFRTQSGALAIALAASSYLLGWATDGTGLANSLACFFGRTRVFRVSTGSEGASVAVKVIENTGPSDSTSFVDPMTGLANRRYLDIFLAREVGRAERFRKPVSVAVFNVDGAVILPSNVVDQVLVEMAKRLTDTLRDYDVVARYSHSRLVVVLPEAPPEEALDITERLRVLLSSLKIESKQIDMSVALASFPEHGSTAEELINAAHYFLNRGKLENPDQVHYPQRLANAS